MSGYRDILGRLLVGCNETVILIETKEENFLKAAYVMKTKGLFLTLIVTCLVFSAWLKGDETEYYAVLMEGAKVGYATHSREVSGGKVTTTEVVDVTLSRMGIALNSKTTETCVETIRGEPISFASDQGMAMMVMKTEGTISRDGMMKVRSSGAGEGQETSVPWPQGAVMAEGLRLMEMEKGLKEGAAYSVKIFSPGLMEAIDSNVLIGAKEQTDLFGRVVTLTKVETTMSMPGMGNITTTSYVDDEFRALKTEMPMMDMKLVLVACEKEVALGGNEIFDIGDKMFIDSPEPIEDAGTARAIAYGLRPTGDANNLTIPAGDNQRVQKMEDGLVIVVVEPVKVTKGGVFPYRGDDKELIEATRPSRFLQSGDAKVIELAKKAVGDTRDSLEAARRIEAFVAGYVENKSLSVGYASAAEVAVSRQGDCSEFSVLCAAMCRAVGIPARVVAGVAYVDDFMGKSGFGGHAWVEAYTGGKWVGLDPTFKSSGRGGYDAGHIALAWGDGEPAKFFNMATTMGRFKIEKVMVGGDK
jgi:hypothetical protein